MAEKNNAASVIEKPAVPIPLDEIKTAIEKIRFGSVQVVIQDGRVVQIESVEKRRLI